MPCPSSTRSRPTWSRERRLQITFSLLLALTLTACTRPPAPENAPAAPFSSGARRDLSQDEAAGGHTLRKHVGRTDAELRERLEREREISAASTWNDRTSAESAVGAAIAEQSGKISRWLARQSGHPNLVLDYDRDSSHPFGSTLRRGEDRVQPCSHALIVLKWDGPNSYHVLTAYPECRS
ncbi:MAG: RNase A-like domain-containing protein [Candidatus Sulfotelmatobacter sp.]